MGIFGNEGHFYSFSNLDAIRTAFAGFMIAHFCKWKIQS